MLDLDFLPYGEALDLMRRLVDVKGSDKWPEILIMLEHEPVLTKGRRAQDSDILVTSDQLADEGISVFQVERGGLITYHGPGQLVVYPVFALHPMKLDVGTLVNGLEQVILDTLAEFGIIARRVEGARGVLSGRTKSPPWAWRSGAASACTAWRSTTTQPGPLRPDQSLRTARHPDDLHGPNTRTTG